MAAYRAVAGTTSSLALTIKSADQSLESMIRADVSVNHIDIPPLPSEDATEVGSEHVKKGKGVGKRLTDRQRVEILELLEKSGGSLSNAEIGRRYGITRAAVQKLKQKGPEVRARYRYGSEATRDGRKRGGHILSVPFEREIFEWVRGLKARKVPVPPSLIKEKAKLLVPKYGLGSFQASNGWYYNFCKRFNLFTGVIMEDKAQVPAEINDTEPSFDLGKVVFQQSIINSHQQNYQEVAAVALQRTQENHEQECCSEGGQSKSDRMLALLEQQNALLERQNLMIEEQAKTIKQLYNVVTTGSSDC
ncbi:hypothetical protein CCR75_002622 [Bremia lactucae]|uniref:HTH CENPB-type domain-containing protein n=1 Tax=Bremia lactucae TaxID=4779 RepID=A0A976ILC7_BRELC|nr:hypothetical protein CCR75_002622 [Bremia lactucae]